MGWNITGTMLSGIIVWGGVGYVLDRWLETRIFTLVGTILGLTVAIYLIVVKYGAVGPPPAVHGQRRLPDPARVGDVDRPDGKSGVVSVLPGDAGLCAPIADRDRVSVEQPDPPPALVEIVR